VDFLRAPERIESLLDAGVASWLARPRKRGTWHTLSATVGFLLQRLERAMGTRTLREVTAFFVALDALFGDVAARAARARALLYSPRTAFVLIVGPNERVLVDGGELAATMRALGAHLGAVVVNRLHPLPGDGDGAPAAVDRVLAELAATGVDATTCAWLGDTWAAARATAAAERALLRPFAAALPAGTTWVEVAELDHDAHSLSDLAELARSLGAL
jgi:anion-transporting  ArsA/GET3 family ATPase